MNDFDIPIFKKAYDLYKLFHEYRKLVPKQDRFTIFERCEQLKLNMLRVFVRLMKDVKAIDAKKYVALEGVIDEIGRMLGGWIRSTKTG